MKLSKTKNIYLSIRALKICITRTPESTFSFGRKLKLKYKSCIYSMNKAIANSILTNGDDCVMEINFHVCLIKAQKRSLLVRPHA